MLACHLLLLDGFDWHYQASIHCSKQCHRYISAASIEKFLGMPRIEPRAAGCEARTLSIVLCLLSLFFISENCVPDFNLLHWSCHKNWQSYLGSMNNFDSIMAALRYSSEQIAVSDFVLSCVCFHSGSGLRTWKASDLNCDWGAWVAQSFRINFSLRSRIRVLFNHFKSLEVLGLVSG